MPDGIIKGSLRTAREDVDVAAEALRYGGGGHRKAAGYTTKGKIVEKENEWTLET
jgi:phosphoesterase RecJ-like protein